MICRPICVLALLVVTVCPAGGANAQAPDCTYDRCALRLQSRLFSERIVQGAAGTPVAGLGLFAPRIEPLATAGDSARAHYESFRTYQNRGGALALVGIVASVASTILLVAGIASESNQSAGVAWGLFGIEFAFSIAGSIHTRKGRDHLHQAIGLYNRSLVTAP